MTASPGTALSETTPSETAHSETALAATPVAGAALAARTVNGKASALIKKYANRRLYDTRTSRYVTLFDLAAMVKDGIEFTVLDVRNGDDITHQILTQIILEEETKGPALLPISFLRALISFYGDSLQSVVPQYLETTMRSFTDNRDEIRRYFSRAFDDVAPFELHGAVAAARLVRGEAGHERDQVRHVNGLLDALRSQLGDMQRQIDALNERAKTT